MLLKQEFDRRYSFDFEDTAQLEEIKSVYAQVVSSEEQPSEKSAEATLQRYQTLFHDYTNVFLAHLSADPLKSETAFRQLNAIQYAASRGYHVYLEQLTLSPKDFNGSTLDGVTPLHLAATYGHLKTVETLLKKGVNQQTLNHRLRLPIFQSLSMANTPEIKNQKIAIYRLLQSSLPQEALFKPDIDGNTIVHQMALNGFDDLIRELIQQKALHTLLMQPNLKQHRPIHVAIFQGQLAVVDCLFKHHLNQKEQLQGHKSRMPTHYAAESGNEAMVELCCEADPESVHQLDSEGKTPWAIATDVGNHHALAVLTRYGDCHDREGSFRCSQYR